MEEEGQMLLDVRQYQKCISQNQVLQPTTFAGELVTNELDGIDSAILKNWNDGRMSLVELASKVNPRL